MKKPAFLLTFLLTMLLLTSVAFAARCESCGSSNLNQLGSGSWCHWDCNDCGSRTSRGHNPNSSNCGLVPVSCSGTCSWCGASAVWSSHSFVNWSSAGDATCTQGGTEIAQCANAQCSATSRRPGPALGHDYSSAVVVPPACESKGYTRHSCTRCDDYYDDTEKPALSHTYGAWAPNGDGTHTAGCTRSRCYNSLTAPCSPTTITVNGQTMTLCPVCGDVSSGDAAADLNTMKSVSAQSLEGKKLPGRLMVLVDAAPFEIPLSADAFYLFVTSFQFSGKAVEFTGKVKVSIDLNEQPFSMPDSIFEGMAPSELMARAFKIVRVAQEDFNGQPAEVWHEMPFTLQNGILTFETDQMGVFLMVLNIADAPSVG